METPAGKRALSKGEKTQELIMKTAIRLFAQRGFEEVSLQEIADECGISRAAPLYHFKTKSGLFEAIVQRSRRRKSEAIAAEVERAIEDDAFQRLAKLFRVSCAWSFISSSEAEAFLLLHYFAAHNAHFARLYQQILGEERRQIEQLLLAGKREGLFSFEEPSRELATALHDVLTGFAVNALAGRNQVDLPDLEARAIGLLSKMTGYRKPDSVKA